MTTSYNGFKAGDPSIFTPPGLDNRPVPGTSNVYLTPGVHRGEIATVLFYVAGQLNARVEPGVPGECWGYADKVSANDANLISCHASGTAFDWNAPAHPNGKTGTFKGKVTEIRKILAEVNNVVYWGGDGWNGGTRDEMHFEIATGTTMADLAAAAAKVSAPAPVPPPAPAPAPAPAPNPVWYHGVIGSRTLQRGCQGDDVGNLQGKLAAGYPLYRHTLGNLNADGIFGPVTEAWVKEFQRRSGLVVDGIVGPRTFAALGVR